MRDKHLLYVINEMISVVSPLRDVQHIYERREITTSDMKDQLDWHVCQTYVNLSLAYYKLQVFEYDKYVKLILS